MNRVMREVFPIVLLNVELRDQIPALITDEELAFRPHARTRSLGELCREMGEVEQSYIDSFRTFRQDFSYRVNDPSIEGSVEKLTAWWHDLDRRFKDAVERLSDEDIAGKKIDRGPDFQPTVDIQLHDYREALLVFCGKASVIQ